MTQIMPRSERNSQNWTRIRHPVLDSRHFTAGPDQLCYSERNNRMEINRPDSKEPFMIEHFSR